MKQNGCWLQHTKEKVKSNFVQSCEMLQEDENEVDGFSTSHHSANLLESMRSYNFFPDSLLKKPPEDLLDDVKCQLDLSL